MGSSVITSMEEFHPSRSARASDPTENGRKESGEFKFKAGLVWTNIVGIAALHVGAIYGVSRIPEMKALTLAWSTIWLFINGAGITIGAHRLWTHRGYKALFILRIFLMLCNTSAMQNSIYIWSRDHRVHHKYTDTDADPHNINRGFFFAHVGWLMMRKHPDVTLKGSKVDLSDLKNDPIVMFQYKYYYWIMVPVGILIPVLVPCYFWSEQCGLSVFAALIRYIFSLNSTWLVNSGAHTWGFRPYDQNIKPTESLTVNLFTYGEGFHNYHHCFPFDYRCEELHFSPINFSGKIIDFFAKIGLAYGLRTASEDMVRARMERTGEGHITQDSKETEHDY